MKDYPAKIRMVKAIPGESGGYVTKPSIEIPKEAFDLLGWNKDTNVKAVVDESKKQITIERKEGEQA